MTRANAEQAKYVPWFAKAGAACSIVPISRFVTDHIFALKSGRYGCLFSLSGVGQEGLTDQELESQLRMIEGALRGLSEGACLYQYTRVMSGFRLPRQRSYANPVTEAFVEDRLRFLDSSAGFCRIDLHWCLTLEPSNVKAFERKPQENAAATSRMLAEFEKTSTLLAGNLGNPIGLQILEKQKVFQFFSYLFNLEEWAEQGQLRGDTGVDRQIVQCPVVWESDHLRIGKWSVQMYSLKTTPEASRPCLFSDLLTLDCDSILCSTWRPKSTTTARHEIDQQEKFISFFRVGVLSRVMAGRDTASLDTGAGAKAANNAVDDLSDVICALDKKAHGEFSLRLLVAARSAAELHSVSHTVHRVFVEARAQIMEETLGNLSAFYAMFPGNGKFNVFPMWLAEDHHAQLSSIFAPHLGHPLSDDLDSEYLNVFETRTRTPFFQDAYVDGVRVQLVLGPTGSGKSVTGNLTIAHEQKYGGFTYIFDIGGSYESVVELYGGRVDRIGKDGPRVNPFALEPTENNIQFLYSFIKLLLTNGGAELEPNASRREINQAVRSELQALGIALSLAGTMPSQRFK
jgi:type IV secretion system protein VirB4